MVKIRVHSCLAPNCGISHVSCRVRGVLLVLKVGMTVEMYWSLQCLAWSIVDALHVIGSSKLTIYLNLLVITLFTTLSPASSLLCTLARFYRGQCFLQTDTPSPRFSLVSCYLAKRGRVGTTSMSAWQLPESHLCVCPCMGWFAVSASVAQEGTQVQTVQVDIGLVCTLAHALIKIAFADIG